MAVTPTVLFTKTRTSNNASSDITGITFGNGNGNKLAIVIACAKSTTSPPAPAVDHITYDSLPGPGIPMTLIASISSSNLTAEIWGAVIGSATMSSGQVAVAYSATAGVSTGTANGLVIVQDAEQNLAPIIASAQTALDNVSNTNSPPATMVTSITNELILSLVGVQESTLAATPAATAINGDTRDMIADVATRAGVSSYSFAQTLAGSHTFGTTFTNAWSKIRVAVLKIGPVPSNTLSINDFGSGQCHQRQPAWSGPSAVVPFSGAYTGADPDDIKIAVMQGASTIVALSTLTGLSINPGAKTWSGTLIVPKGGGYTNGYTTTYQSMLLGVILVGPQTTTNLWGVGDCAVFMGDSNGQYMELDGTAGGGGITPNPKLGMLSTNGPWITPFGDGLITLGNALLARNGYDGAPLCIYNTAQGGSELAEWVLGTGSGNPSVASSWTILLAAFSPSKPMAIIFDFCGTNDIRHNTLTSQAAYETLWANYLALIDSSFGGTTNFIHSCFAQVNVSGNATLDQATWGRAGEMNAVSLRANTYYSSTIDFAVRASDGLHILQSDMLKVGTRLAQIANRRYFGGTDQALGPQPLSAVRSGSNIIFAFTLNDANGGLVNSINDGLYAVTATDFEVTDAGGAVQTINSATATSLTEYTLAMASPPAAGWLAYYIRHSHPSGNAVGTEPNVVAGKA